jgi:hypothetical protein
MESCLTFEWFDSARCSIYEDSTSIEVRIETLITTRIRRPKEKKVSLSLKFS